MMAVRRPMTIMETMKQAQPFQYSVGGTKANRSFQKIVRKCMTYWKQEGSFSSPQSSSLLSPEQENKAKTGKTISIRGGFLTQEKIQELGFLPELTVMASINCSLQLLVPITSARLVFFRSLSTVL